MRTAPDVFPQVVDMFRSENQQEEKAPSDAARRWPEDSQVMFQCLDLFV